jgi:hypothetical protein
MNQPALDEKTIEQTTKNIELVGCLIDELIDGATELDEEARTTPLVLLPVDDPEQAQANFELSLRAMDRGEAVRLQLVGKRPVDADAWKATDIHSIRVTELRPHWPDVMPLPDDVRLVYDKSRDTLLITFKTRRRRFVSIPVNRNVAVQIDPKTSEVSGYLIVSFLQMVAPQSPTLISALRKAQVRRITERELGGVLISGDERDLSARETADVIHELSRLTA